MKPHQDPEFVDHILEAQVKVAFDTVEPSREAQGRMLANLLAYQQDRSSAEGVAPSTAAESSENAAETVASARAATPKPKRKIRPWQIAVPAAAVLALVAVVLVAGPLTGALAPKGAATSPSEESALQAEMQDSLEEESMESSVAGVSSELSSMNMGSSEEAPFESPATASAPEEDSMALDSSRVADEATASTEAATVPAAEDTTAETEEKNTASEEENQDEGSASGEQETLYPRDYPTIVVVIGEEYRLKIDSTTPANTDDVGSYVADASALGTDEESSVGCAIYNALSDEELYYISYMGEDTYYPAHVLD